MEYSRSQYIAKKYLDFSLLPRLCSDKITNHISAIKFIKAFGWKGCKYVVQKLGEDGTKGFRDLPGNNDLRRAGGRGGIY